MLRYDMIRFILYNVSVKGEWQVFVPYTLWSLVSHTSIFHFPRLEHFPKRLDARASNPASIVEERASQVFQSLEEARQGQTRALCSTSSAWNWLAGGSNIAKFAIQEPYCCWPAACFEWSEFWRSQRSVKKRSEKSVQSKAFPDILQLCILIWVEWLQWWDCRLRRVFAVGPDRLVHSRRYNLIKLGSVNSESSQHYRLAGCWSGWPASFSLSLSVWGLQKRYVGTLTAGVQICILVPRLGGLMAPCL